MRFLAALVTILVLGAQQVRAEDDPDYLYALTLKGGMTTSRYARPEFVERMRPGRPDGVSVIWATDADISEETGRAAAEQEIEVITQVVGDVIASHPGAVLALTSVRGKTQGVWAFYTDDGPDLSKALEAKLPGKTKTHVLLRAGKDPEWKALSRFLGRLQDEK